MLGGLLVRKDEVCVMTVFREASRPDLQTARRHAPCVRRGELKDCADNLRVTHVPGANMRAAKGSRCVTHVPEAPSRTTVSCRRVCCVCPGGSRTMALQSAPIVWLGDIVHATTCRHASSVKRDGFRWT